MRRTAAEAEETRAAILDAARRIFAAESFAGASTTAVAEAAGVTRGAVYHHFADKTDLFRAVFVEITGELNETVLGAAGRASGSLDAFRAGCAAWIDFAVRPDYQRIAVVDAPAVLGVAAWHEIDSGVGLASMGVGLEVLERDGLLARPRSRELTVLAFGALTEAGLAIARGENIDREAVLDTLVALLVDA